MLIHYPCSECGEEFVVSNAVFEFLEKDEIRCWFCILVKPIITPIFNWWYRE